MIEGKFIAVGLIWIGVGISAFGAKEGAIGVAFFAMFATMFVVR